MALSTTPSEAASARVTVEGSALCAVVRAASAGVHGPLVSAAVACLLIAVALAYLLSRTTGIPGLTEHQEPFDTFGAVVSLLEVAAAVMAVRRSNPRRY
jgi:hypothetical protein